MSKTVVVLTILKALGLFSLARWVTRRKLRILCYHGLWYGGQPQYGDCLYMDPKQFEERMRWLAASAYPVLPLDEAIRRLDEGGLPNNAVVITIDDGWYSTYRGMVPVLRDLDLPATLYVTTYYVTRGGPVLNVLLDYMVNRAAPSNLSYAELLLDLPAPAFKPDSDSGRALIAEQLARTTDQLPNLQARLEYVLAINRKLRVDLNTILAERLFDLMTETEVRACQAAGIDIQLHTHTHRMHQLDPGKVTDEIVENRAQLARILGSEPGSLRHFCFPSGVYSEHVFDALRASGVVSATTTESGLVSADDERMRLSRILDCQSMTQIELEARLSGIWELLSAVRNWIRLQPAQAHGPASERDSPY